MDSYNVSRESNASTFLWSHSRDAQTFFLSLSRNYIGVAIIVPPMLHCTGIFKQGQRQHRFSKLGYNSYQEACWDTFHAQVQACTMDASKNPQHARNMKSLPKLIVPETNVSAQHLCRHTVNEEKTLFLSQRTKRKHSLLVQNNTVISRMTMRIPSSCRFASHKKYSCSNYD